MGGGGDTTRRRRRLGPPTPPGTLELSKLRAAPIPEQPPAQALGSLGSGHTLPVAPSRVLGRGEIPPTLLTAGGKIQRGPETRKRTTYPVRTRRSAPRLPTLQDAGCCSGASLPGARLSASQGRRSEEPALGLPDKLTQENVPPGAGGGAHCSVRLCHAAGMQTGRSGACHPAPPPRRRSAPRAWPASSGVALGGPRSSLRPPERTLPAQPHACWVPAWPDSARPADPGILARGRPKPGNRDQR